jgi:hypothetical protein
MANKWEFYNLGDNNAMVIYGTTLKAQTFTVGSLTHKVTSIKVKLYRVGDAGTCSIGIRETSDDLPYGDNLTEAEFEASTITTNEAGAWYDFPVTEYELNAETKYAIVIEAPEGTVTPVKVLYWRADFVTAAYTGGEVCEYTTGWGWVAWEEFDFMFEIWGNFYAGSTLYSGLAARLLITDDTYDESLATAIDEAMRYVVMRLWACDTEFSPADVDVDTALFDIILDLAAGIFKRRHMPQDMDQGWWAQGLKKLESYILSTYKTGIVYFSEEETEEE